MENEHQTHSAAYRHAREAFEGLKIEDKAVFLVEAAVTTIARGVEEAGRALSREMDDLFRERRASDSAAEPTAPPAPESPAPGPTTEPPPVDDDLI